MVEGRDLGVYVKVFREASCKMVAACDMEVLGRTFMEGRLRLDVKEGFYKGELRELDETVELVREADVANLTGPRIVEAVVEGGLVDAAAVIYIEGVPHVQILRL